MPSVAGGPLKATFFSIGLLALSLPVVPQAEYIGRHQIAGKSVPYVVPYLALSKSLP